MGIEAEAAVRAFIDDWESEQSWDTAQIERILSHMTADARYQVFAWEDAFVGHDAIRTELSRQAPGFGGTRIDVATVASVGQTVFVERVDWITVDGTRIGIHVVGCSRSTLKARSPATATIWTVGKS